MSFCLCCLGQRAGGDWEVEARAASPRQNKNCLVFQSLAAAFGLSLYLNHLATTSLIPAFSPIDHLLFPVCQPVVKALPSRCPFFPLQTQEAKLNVACSIGTVLTLL